MPQATNLVVKNGTAVDKTFALVTPAAGDGGVAQWALKDGPISSVFPRFTALTRASAKNSRILQLRLRVPSSYSDAVTGLTNVGSAFEVNCTVSVPNDFPEAKKDDAAAFAVNILATALVKEMIKDAVPAT